MNRKNGNRNDGDIQFDINNEKKINDPLGNFLEKGKNMISEYMNDKFKRLNGIILKEEELKIKRAREDGQRAREDEQRARRDAKRAREKLEEDIQIEKEKKINKFEDEIKLVDLEKNLKAIIYDSRKEKIIPLNEELEEENQDNADIKSKKKKEKKLI